jgi:hypothetical protein
MFNCPSGLAIDSSDNIYVADSLNHVIRKVTPGGEVTTFAGKNSADGGYKDGASSLAMFNEPSDLGFDKSGVLYILDSGNQMVRKISSGQVTTYAGFKSGQIEGTAYLQGGFENGSTEQARFNFPKGMCITEGGVIFIADTWNHRVRAINTDGTVVTVAGTGNAAKKDGAASEAEMNGPSGVLYYSGTLYISDMWNNCIRAIKGGMEDLTGVVDRMELLKGIQLAPKDGETQVWLDGKRIEYPDTKPSIKDGKVYLPVRYTFEGWGAQVKWVNATRAVIISKDKLYKVLVAPRDPIIFKDGRAMMDTKNLAKLTGLRVEWFPEYNAVIISTGK